MRVFLSNVGCKLNQAELEELARRFQSMGHEIVGSLEDADLHVVNTCTVTHVAARDSRKVARRGRRCNPDLKTVLTGCYVETDTEEAARLTGVDLIVPNMQKDRLVERIEEAFDASMPALGTLGPSLTPCSPLELGTSRAPVKIEDGCNMRCSFCVIPSTRGRQRSRPLPDIVEQVGMLTDIGHLEVVLTGVQISSYRWRGHGLYELTKAILRDTSVARLRLTSIAPWQFDRRLLQLFASPRLCRHVHLSLQSGCAETLRRMRRPYSCDDFAQLVTALRTAVEGIAVTTDVIVGFPEETDEEFERSLQFTRGMEFARIHVFPFSPRARTEAARHPRQVPAEAKRRRTSRMLDVARLSRERFEHNHIGTTAQVLWEGCQGGVWKGTTDNYLRVATRSEANLQNQITPVRLTDRAGASLIGVPISPQHAPIQGRWSPPPDATLPMH